MSTLLRLYPRAWRERYGDELVALLEEHPLTAKDLIDLIRGALDAHLHPQVRGTAASDKELPVNQRLLGVLAAIGGLAWLIGFATLLVMPLDAYGNPDGTIAFLAAIPAVALIGTALGELGTRPGSPGSRRTGHVIAIASLGAAALIFFPWPIFVIGIFAFPVIGMLGAGRGAQNGVFPRWYVAVFVVAALASMAGFLGGVSQPAAIVFMTAVGASGPILAWITIRGPAAGTSRPEAAHA